jgi:CPA1 family monovalent cation:H+ antiporter
MLSVYWGIAADLLLRRLRLKALRAQRQDLYGFSCHHQNGYNVLRQVWSELDLSESSLRQVR